MRGRRLMAVAAAMLLVLVGACSSSSHSAGSERTYTIGVLTDLTGLAASGSKTSVLGIQAGIHRAELEGYTIKYVVADTATSPAGALSAAQKLVDEDHVFVVIGESALTFAAAQFLTSKGIPVIGNGQDGAEWKTAPNMFANHGITNPTGVATTAGMFFKSHGVTSVGAVGYSVPASSADAAKSYAASSQAAGLKVGYLNANFPLGSTNVQPLALGMKSAGVDGFVAPLESNTVFATITALKQVGVNLKAALVFSSYGGDLTSAGPGASEAAQGAYFDLDYEPVEMHTGATERLQNDLRSVGVSSDPTLAEYNGYVDMAMLVQGLQGAGAKPTQAGLIRALDGIHDFDAAGLWGNLHVDLGGRQPIPFGTDDCAWFTRLVGSTFQLVPGQDPLCGTTIPGKSISS